MPKITVTRVYTGSSGVPPDPLFPFDWLVDRAAYPDRVAAGAALVSVINGATAGDVIAVAPGDYQITTAPTWKANLTVAAYGGTVDESPAIIRGDGVLTGWVKDGAFSRWSAPASFQTRDSTMRDGTYSVCEDTALDGTNLCWDRDRVWIDNTRMTPVGSLAAGEAGSGNRYWLNRPAGRVYVWTNPAGHTIEIDKAPYFVNGATVSGVKFRRLTIQRFASPLQRAGVSIAGNNWNMDTCVFRDNHAAGLHASNVSGLWVHDSQFLTNGQEGLVIGNTSSSTTPSGTVIEDSHFEGNNQDDFYIGDWEAGGFKTTSRNGGIVRNCSFKDNRGLDLWADFASQWIFENCTSDNAWGQACRIEVATNCIVRGLTIIRSGSNIGEHYRASHTNWSTVMDTCAISVSESQWVEVYGCTISDPSLNGIIINVRARQTTHHVFVHDNTITQRQAPVPTGAPGTSTVGTMIAGGINRSGSSQPINEIFSNPLVWSMPGGSGVLASQSVEVSNNNYFVGDLTTTRRFVWRNGIAGSNTTYYTAANYLTQRNAQQPGHGEDIQI